MPGRALHGQAEWVQDIHHCVLLSHTSVPGPQPLSACCAPITATATDTSQMSNMSLRGTVSTEGQLGRHLPAQG